MKIIRYVLLFFGISFCLYPMAAHMVHRFQQKRIIGTYESNVSIKDTNYLNDMRNDAKEYNRNIYELQSNAISSKYPENISEDKYNSLLNPGGSGVMGLIMIPKIELELPIYHGVSEEVLAAGIGHLRSSSLPIGGENTRTILTGHSGLPDAELFTRLDELKNGDKIYLTILDQTLVYSVVDISIIEPNDADSLRIIPGMDLLTLVTCTPYGINTHRLLVTGVRGESEEENMIQESETISFRSVILTVVPILISMYGVMRFKKKGGLKRC